MIDGTPGDISVEGQHLTFRFDTRQVLTLLVSVMIAAGSVVGGVWLSNRDLRITVDRLDGTVMKLDDTVKHLDRRVPDRVPPQWFEDKVTELEAKIASDRLRMDRLFMLHATDN